MSKWFDIHDSKVEYEEKIFANRIQEFNTFIQTKE